MQLAAITSENPNKFVDINSIPNPSVEDDQILIKVNNCSGTVVAIGKHVENFEIGNYVSAFTHGGYKNNPFGGSFQEYVAVDQFSCIKYQNLNNLKDEKSTIPAGKITTFEAAAAINLSLATVGMSFYHGFELDIKQKTSDKNKNWVLIWGGATSTGMLAIQIAKQLYGLNVITTASEKHFKLLKDLGADFIFNYNDGDVILKIKNATGNNIKYALDTVSDVKTFNGCNECLRTTENAFLVNLLALEPDVIENIKPNVT
ncbi:hypothetical protein DAMA08_044010 [Martiniozyma asiatica (nom. inval.)]|nr:hypothetical protein DAMA08_044010 [Martiniozyma asiatica]